MSMFSARLDRSRCARTNSERASIKERCSLATRAIGCCRVWASTPVATRAEAISINSSLDYKQLIDVGFDADDASPDTQGGDLRGHVVLLHDDAQACVPGAGLNTGWMGRLGRRGRAADQSSSGAMMVMTRIVIDASAGSSEPWTMSSA